jgi:hypothetical protein
MTFLRVGQWTSIICVMRGGTIKPGSIVAASILSVLTLAVFFTLRNYGPQSAVRRFHQAVASRNPTEMSRYAEEVPSNPELLELGSFVYQNMMNGQPRLIAVQPGNNRAKVLVVYQNKFAAPQPVVFIVDQDTKTHLWRVNCSATFSAIVDYTRSVNAF